MATAIHRLSEFFLLRDLEKSAREAPAEERARVTSAHARARQKRVAAEALWIAGSPAEGLRLAQQAAEILRALQPGDAAAETPVLPELDEQVSPADNDRYYALIAEIDRLVDRQLPVVFDERAVRMLRVKRVAVAASVALSLVFVAWFILRTPKVLKAEASAQYDAAHEPARAVDGNDKSDWLLPDKSLGWLDVHVVPARNLKKVKVINGRNTPWNDRATQDFHLEVFNGAELVKQFDGKFESHSPEPTFRTFDLGTKVDRVRLTVKSFHGTGAGIAEIEVE